MAESRKKVAVIGCGVTGLTAIKSCLDEGLLPVCYEMSDDIGGIWCYRDVTDYSDKASVFKATVTNTSKEAMCFSDFPFPKEWPNFLHHPNIKKYCDMYADRFGLKKHIMFSCKVTRLEMASDYDASGRWVVASLHDNKDEQVNEFDAVMICTGKFGHPFTPTFDGLNEFQGRVLHTHKYRRPEEFEGRRVLVIGIGNSGSDAASEIGCFASKVFLSARRGTWLMSRRGENAIPWDLDLLRSWYLIPAQLRMMFFEKSQQSRYGMIMNSLRPAHAFTSCEPVLTEDLPGRILTGAVVVRTSPERFTNTGVIFKDGTYEDIDAVVMATGYRDALPFHHSCSALELKDGHVPLYKHLFPLGLKHSTLSVHGNFKPLGSLIPCVELQARWASRVFVDLAALPSQSQMEAEVKMTNHVMEKAFLPNYQYVDAVAYSNSVAEEIGARPNYLRLLLTDPMLAIRCMYGPHLSYKYRLEGPGKWDGARNAITTVWERVLAPTQTRPVPQNDSGNFLPVILICLISVIAISVSLWF